jgi:hypothetical protein
MLSTKVEINVCKAEPGTWAEFSFARAVEEVKLQIDEPVDADDSDSDVDLDDVGPVPTIGHCTITEFE